MLNNRPVSWPTLIQNHANLRHFQDLLGRRSLATTERYLRLTIADLKEAHANSVHGSRHDQARRPIDFPVRAGLLSPEQSLQTYG